MILNTLKSSYRYIINSKVFTIINLIGLIAGLSASFILLLFALNEISFDKDHEGSDRIYRVLNKDKNGTKTILTPYSLAPALLEDTVNVENSGRLVYIPYITGPVRVNIEGTFYDEPSFVCADPGILNILTFNVINGSSKNCLSSPSGVLLSESAAKKYFGDENPIGKSLNITTMGVFYTLNVCGIYKDLPWNSSLKMEVIAGMPLFIQILKNYYPDPELVLNQPNDVTVETYIKLRPERNLSDFLRKVPVTVKGQGYNPVHTRLVFQKLTDIYLSTEKIEGEVHKRGNKNSLYVYAILSLFILLLAGINYSILSIARSTLRFKEVGVRKIMGARKAALKSQLLIESVLMSFLAFPVSFLIIGFIEPFFNNLYDYQISLYSGSLALYLALFAVITLFVGMISGIYIAFFLSSLNAWDALRNQVVAYKQISLSRIFTIFQLFITISLMISVITVFLQLHYAKKNNDVIPNTNLLMIVYNSNEFKGFTQLKADLLKLPEIINVTGINRSFPDQGQVIFSIQKSNSKKGLKIEMSVVDKDFFRTIGAKIIKGKDFGDADELPGQNKIIINKAAEQAFGLKNPIGEAIIYNYTIVGVVDDFNIHTVHSKINPIIFICNPKEISVMIIRYKPGTEKKLLSDLGTTWKKHAPTVPLTPRFFKDEMNRVYQKEQTFGQVVSSFAILAFIIMGVGLFGLALLISERKAKEIAIRKVFGATSSKILVGMQKDFFSYIVIASLIAVPVSWFAMHRWLDSFYYKIQLSWWIFAVAILTVTIFVGVIIFLRSYKVLKENPINALKYE